MILGIGNDITDIRRIEKMLDRYGERFEQRVFTDNERTKATSRRKAGPKIIAGTYAKRFAAKEACSKALGTGLSMGTRWRDMEVVNLPSGQPTLQLHGRVKERLNAMTPKGMRPILHLTLTDEYPLATAVVIISAVSMESA
jgi:holo-[acyl-carrier protein] synthase